MKRPVVLLLLLLYICQNCQEHQINTMLHHSVLPLREPLWIVETQIISLFANLQKNTNQLKQLTSWAEQSHTQDFH